MKLCPLSRKRSPLPTGESLPAAHQLSTTWQKARVLKIISKKHLRLWRIICDGWLLLNASGSRHGISLICSQYALYDFAFHSGHASLWVVPLVAGFSVPFLFAALLSVHHAYPCSTLRVRSCINEPPWKAGISTSPCHPPPPANPPAIPMGPPLQMKKHGPCCQ